MRKVNTIIGQELISLTDGHRIAPVKDVILDSHQEHVAALVVQEAGLMSGARIVPIDEVRSYGRDAIVIEGDATVVDAGGRPDIEVADGPSLAGMRVYTNTGEQVGSIADVYFEEDDGRIVGFEISAGAVGDIADGRRFLPAEQLDHIGEEVVYVRPDASERMEPVPDGSRGALGTIDDLKSTVADASHQAGQTLAEAGAKVGAAVESQAKPEKEDGPRDADLVGRRSGADVSDADGRIIVANGQLISGGHVERAHAAGRGDALRAAADAWSAAERERVISGAVEQVVDTAGGAWDSFMRKISELTDATGKRMSEQETKARLAAINDAVGRPVTKVILDRSDDVVLNLGDIITHEAVQRAYEAGILDSLLASVYKGDVAFERDEMKAAGQGTSTVEKATGGSAVIDELQTSVDTAESEREQVAQQKRRESDEARDLRDLERQDRAQARAEAAERATAGEPLPAERQPAQARGASEGAGSPQLPDSPRTGASDAIGDRRTGPGDQET
jgi:uncharacterized protein YrrD